MPNTVTYNGINATYNGLQIYLGQARNITVSISEPITELNLSAPVVTNVLINRLATAIQYSINTSTLTLSVLPQSTSIDNLQHELVLTGPHGD